MMTVYLIFANIFRIAALKMDRSFMATGDSWYVADEGDPSFDDSSLVKLFPDV